MKVNRYRITASVFDGQPFTMGYVLARTAEDAEATARKRFSLTDAWTVEVTGPLVPHHSYTPMAWENR